MDDYELELYQSEVDRLEGRVHDLECALEKVLKILENIKKDIENG